MQKLNVILIAVLLGNISLSANAEFPDPPFNLADCLPIGKPITLQELADLDDDAKKILLKRINFPKIKTKDEYETTLREHIPLAEQG